MLILPSFVHSKNRFLTLVLCGIIFYLGYAIPNHNHLFDPKVLPMTKWDLAIPLMPWTVLIYVSEYFKFVLAFFLFRNDETRNKYVCSFLGILAFSIFFFIFFPTTYPRNDYPIPTDTNSFIYHLFSFLRMIDDPSNSFPSLHVSCCYLTANAFLNKGESKLNFFIYGVWATAIALSTLTTKQHYVIDAVSGFAVGLSAYWIFFKKTKYVSLEEFKRVITTRVRSF